MSNQENLIKNLERNEELLKSLLKKKDNLELQISQLQNKISNQKHNLSNLKKQEK